MYVPAKQVAPDGLPVPSANCPSGTCNCIKKRDARANVVVKFREVSDSVWVSFEAVIIEKTLKEE